jgi:DeoD family purine-nucleoside phosphorylase
MAASSLRSRAVPRDPIHLQPTAPLAGRVLLPGDPGRALLLAQTLLDGPKMFNHHRGLWGYTGPAADGELLTIQATGMGGPSAAIVLEELADLGVTRAVRVGTCGALDGSLALGDLVVASEALAQDGTSRALGAGSRIAPDASLTAALSPLADADGLVVSTDLFYEPDPSRESAWREAGALAVEMEAAALFAVGARRGVAVGCVLAVSDVLVSGRARIADDALRDASERVGRAGAAALGIRS